MTKIDLIDFEIILIELNMIITDLTENEYTKKPEQSMMKIDMM